MKIYKIKVNGKSYRVELEALEEVASEQPKVEKKVAVEQPQEKKAAPSVEGQQVTSPIQGTVTNVKVRVGDHVKKGDVLLIIEAMKLENEVPSPFDGEVSEVLVSKGQNVASKEVVVVIK